MPGTFTDNDLFQLQHLQLPSVANKVELEPLHDSKLPSAAKPEIFDSPDEQATKEAVKEYLAEHSEPNVNRHSVSMPDLPVQYNNPTAKRLYELFYQTHIEDDRNQNIESKLYQAKNGKVIFCMDERDYKPNKENDPCYSYARYGIGLYLSQHLLYKIGGVKDTDFIADNAQRFYQQFIADIQRYQKSLVNLSADERAEKLNDYARDYLSDVAHSIAEQLTDAFGEQEEFKDIETTLRSLDKIVPGASMAFEPIPHVTIENFKYQDPNISELADISEDYVTIVHPKTNKMTDQIRPYWDEKLKLTNNTTERKPRPASDIEPLTDDLEVDEDTIYNFLDELHPCEEALLHYLGDAILAGKVAFTSQWKKLPGAKNFRTFEQMEFTEEKGTIQLLPIGNITGCSTALATLKNASESVLIDFNHATLMQKHAMMARGTDRPLRLCSISLCGIDLTTELANKVFNKSIVPVDAQSISVTDAATKGTSNQVFFSNLTTNHEQHAGKLQHAPKLVQKAVAKIMRYDKLQEMLPYIHYTKGIDENVRYIEAFKNEFAERISPEDCKRLDVHLRLMAKVQKLHESGTLDGLEILLDTIAIFAMLCTVYNELILKYDTNKKYANIIVPINCASGKNRTGAVISHCMGLSRTADIIVKKFGIDELENLLDPKYYLLRRAIGNDQAEKGLISKDNGRRSTLGAEGIREQSESSISRIDVAKSVRKRMCSPAAEFKGLMANVYIPNKDRIDILRDATLQEIALGKKKDTADKQKAYRDIIAGYSMFSILYTLRNLRAPDALKWLPAVDAELIHAILIEKVEASASKGILVQDNLGLYLPPIPAKAPVMDLAVDEKVVPVMPDNPSPSIQSNSEIVGLSNEKDDWVPIQPNEKKPSLKQIVLGKMATLVPKEIGLIQKHLGLHFFSEQPKNDVMVLNREKTDLVGNPHPTRQDENTQSLPQEHRKKKGNTLKIGSIIAGLFVVLAPIIAYIELHGISIFAAMTLAASAMTGWWYAREDESDKKKNSVYGGSKPNQTFFSPEPKAELAVSKKPDKQDILRRY